METPVIPAPTDAQEQQVLEQLSLIRDQLLLLKQDRTKYIRSQDVIPLYDQTIEQVRILNEHRSAGEHSEENRVDRVLDSCFQLLSLFFMTIGRNNEAPAAYALTSTIRRILDHLAEAGLYSAKDLASLSRTLEKVAANIDLTSTTHSPYLITRLSKRVEKCLAAVATLQERLDMLGEPLLATHEKLISLLRSISLLNTRTRFSASEVKKLQAQLQEIDAQRVDGKFLTESGDVAKGSEEVSSILERCLIWAELVLERKGVMPESFKPIYDALVGTRNDLEKVSLTQAWSLRETDLWDFQRKLDRIDESRVNGNWLDELGKPAELYVQRTLLYLIRRSYGYIYALMISSEPVSEALLPIFNQLQTLKRCLIEVKDNGGVSSERELYPYSMKLHSLQNMQTDGKFIVNGDIPEGQASVTELLAECFELNYELRVAALEIEGSQKDEDNQANGAAEATNSSISS